MGHPPYIPDLAIFDLWRGSWWLQNACFGDISMQMEKYNENGFQRKQKCIDDLGECFEKQ